MNKILTVADVLQISVPTLYRWIASGKVKAIKLPNGDLRITNEELNRLCKGEEVK
jgi:excisionase family DNA binding protein